MRMLVLLHGGGDLDHLQERDRALLHPGTARARRGQQRQPLAGGAFHRRGDPFCCRHADGPGEEVELARDDRDATPVHPALSGHHRLVQPGGSPGLG